MTKQPSYRFVRYTEAWEQRKLGEVAQYRNGKAHENCIDENGKYIVVNSKFISTDGEVKKFSNKKNEALFENEIAFVLSDVPNGRAIARTFWVEKNDKYTLNQRIAGITPIGETFPYFLYILMNRHPYFLAFDDGAKQTNLSVSDVMGFEAYYPKYSEQQKIGAYFRNLDHLITLQQRKLEVLKEQKKTYLKLLFPAKGQTKPALRFAGFEDEWKEVKLGEVTNRYDNLRVPVSANERISGDTPYYGANGIQDYVDGYTHDGEFILIAEDGASDLKDYPVQYVNGKVWVNNHAHVIQGKKDLINNIFLLFAVKQINIEPFLVGGGRAKLNSDIMMKLPLYLPTLPEQEVIGSFFQDLDKAIGKQEEKVNQLKESKQSLLRKMFI